MPDDPTDLWFGPPTTDQVERREHSSIFAQPGTDSKDLQKPDSLRQPSKLREQYRTSLPGNPEAEEDLGLLREDAGDEDGLIIYNIFDQRD